MRWISYAVLAFSLWLLWYGHWVGALFGVATCVAIYGRNGLLRDAGRSAIGGAAFAACSLGWPVLVLVISGNFPGMDYLASAPHWAVTILFYVPGIALGVAAWIVIERYLWPKRRSN